MNGTGIGVGQAYTYARAGRAIGHGFSHTIYPLLDAMRAEEQELDDLIDCISRRHKLTPSRLRQQIEVRARGSGASILSAAYAVSAELEDRQPRPEPVTAEQMEELRARLAAMGRVDAAKRRWQPPQSFRRRGSRN